MKNLFLIKSNKINEICTLWQKSFVVKIFLSSKINQFWWYNDIKHVKCQMEFGFQWLFVPLSALTALVTTAIKKAQISSFLINVYLAWFISNREFTPEIPIPMDPETLPANLEIESHVLTATISKVLEL